MEAQSSHPTREASSDPNPASGPGSLAQQPAWGGVPGTTPHSSLEGEAGSRPNSASPGHPQASGPAPIPSPEGSPRPRADATSPGGQKPGPDTGCRSRPPTLGHTPPARLPSLPAARVAAGRPGKPGPGPGAATCAPGPAPCLRKRRSEPEARPGPRAPQSPTTPAAPLLTRRSRDQRRRRRRQHEEEQPGTRSSGRRLHGPAATACGPARPGRRLALASLASPHLPRRGSGLASALCNCSGAARPLAAGLPPAPPPGCRRAAERDPVWSPARGPAGQPIQSRGRPLTGHALRLPRGRAAGPLPEPESLGARRRLSGGRVQTSPGPADSPVQEGLGLKDGRV